MATPRLPAEGVQRVVPISEVHPSPLNPRKHFAEGDLDELANSLIRNGFVQPIITRADAAGGYEIVAGERRWRAAQKAGIHEIPIIVREMDDRKMMEQAIVENVQRADLNPIEEATGYNELIQRFQYTQEQLAETIGKSRSHLANTLRLLKLPDKVQEFVFEGRISAGHARALIGRDDAEVLAHRIIENGMSVRDVEALVQRLERNKQAVADGVTVRRDKDADTKAFERALSEALGLKVEIKRGSGESGQLVIKFGNFDQLDYIRTRITGANS